MKRSEIIEIIVERLRCEPDFGNYYDQAKDLLEAIEKAGMTPPHDLKGFLDPGVWIHEED